MTDTGPNTTTRGERMLALRKARMAAVPPILRGGFRPFFFGGPLWAVVALVLWLTVLLGGLELPSAFDALSWHRHEMLFGFVGAIVAGFLLTAIPNWTGRLPIAGTPLLALFALWLAGRLALVWSEPLGLLPAAVLDVGFYVAFALIAGREVIAAKNRNMPVIAMVLLFGLANALDYAAVSGLVADSEAGFRAGIALVVMIIAVIGGRIIPSFTRNWMVKQGWREGLPSQPDWLDLVALAVTSLALAAWFLAPDTHVAGVALLSAAAAQFVRLARWRGWRTWNDPIVSVLHIGFLWVPVGLLLLGWSILDFDVPRTSAIHALTAGAMGTMILAVMTRATLGHTGRDIAAGPATVMVYALVTLGALFRVIAPLGVVDHRLGIEAAGVLWASAIVVFILAYAPILFRPRVGETGG